MKNKYIVCLETWSIKNYKQQAHYELYSNILLKVAQWALSSIF